MRLERFRVSNFRSVNDSGWIDVAGTTAFVGRNESGKTNLLQALASLNDARVPRELSRTRDFPADRLHNDYSDALDVVRTTWVLTDAERASLAGQMPEAQEVERVEVGRGFRADRWVRFVGLPDPAVPNDRVCDLLTRVHAVPADAGGLPDPAWVRGVAALEAAAKRRCEDPRAWGNELSRAMATLQAPLQSGNMVLGDDAREALEEIAEISMQVATEPEFGNNARDWVLRRLPRFLYLEQYPEIEGCQNLAEFAARQREGRPAAGDFYFSMLLRVSGIEPDQVESLLGGEPEMRRQTASRAGTVLTRTLRRIWTDRALKVRFDIDGEHFNTLVSSPTTECDIEVNLNQRSRGFRWFFSFYVMFAAGEKDGSTSQTLLLLDEPGLHLHSHGQRDLLNHLSQDLSSQVLLATQSPFMLPGSDDSAILLVESSEELGTVAVDGQGAKETLGIMLPADATAAAEQTEPEAVVEVDDAAVATVEAKAEAAPARLDLGLMVDRTPALLLENLTDYWYLLVASDYLELHRRTSLPKDLALTPVGAAARSPMLREQLSGGSREVYLLVSDRFESEGDDVAARQSIWIGEGLDEVERDAALNVDVEDLLSSAFYHRFVCFTYRQELGDVELDGLDETISQTIERYETAFAAREIEFRRARVARLILKGTAKNPEVLMTEATAERFERLFESIRKRL